MLAVRRTAQAGATPGVGLQLCEARFRPRWLRPAPLKLPYWGRTTYSFLTKWAGRPGGTATLDAQAACCGPPVGRRPARATRWVAEARLIWFRTFVQFCWVRAARSGGGPKAQRAGPAAQRAARARPLCYEVRPQRAPLKRRPRRGRRFCESRYSLSVLTVRRQRRAATSSDELQPAAWGGGGLRDPLGRKNSATSTAQISQVRPVAHPPERLRRWATGPAVRRTAEAQPICFRPQSTENEY